MLFYYKSSKNNEKDEWKSGVFKSVEQHYAVIQSDLTSRTTKVAYEDIRIRPASELTNDLMMDTVEYYLEKESGRPRPIDGGGGARGIEKPYTHGIHERRNI